jgi:hypothetical protein
MAVFGALICAVSSAVEGVDIGKDNKKYYTYGRVGHHLEIPYSVLPLM